MLRKIGILVAVLLIVGAAPGWSVSGSIDHWIDDKAASDNYGVKFGGMFLQGFYDIVESPYELLYHTYDRTVHETNYGLGVLTGLGSGVYHMVENLAYGVWNIVTSPVPNYHGLEKTHDHEAVGESTA